MGKKSLLKSTAKTKKKIKPKAAAKAKASPKAKPAAKAKAAPKAKPAVKTKAPPKAKAAAKAKAAPKAKAVAKAKAAPKAKMATSAPPKKPAPKTGKKKVSMKELIHKKFGKWKPDKLYTVSPDEKYLKGFAAPPFASGSKEEIQRIKQLLLKKFDLAEIKAAAEKAAAEKAAAEKAAAEKAAAEKAAAEKAAAEKAAAEKAAAEKAAAEKAAAEKAAAEKAAEAEVAEPPVDSDTTVSDPMEKAMKYLVAAVVVLVALIVGSSMINKTKYYMDEKQGALEIWQGRFAPMGEELLITLPGVQLPETTKAVYLKKDVFPIIFNYYVEKADTLLEVPGMPDFEGIKSYLNRALSYAVTSASTEAAFNRLNNIELMILFYKADVAAGKATLPGLKNAKHYLDQAARLSTNDLQADIINQKIDAVNKQIAALKATEKGAKPPAPAPPAPAHSSE
jgi:colicin import membrane protein